MPTQYVREFLLPNEQIIFSTHRHWIVFWPVLIWFGFAILYTFFPDVSPLAVIFFIGVGCIHGFFCFVNYKMSELVVTNMRVIIKRGWISRHSLETNFQNIASISVDQSILARLFGYGTISIFDTGQVESPYSCMEKPFKFRQAVQKMIDGRFPVPPKGNSSRT